MQTQVSELARKRCVLRALYGQCGLPAILKKGKYDLTVELGKLQTNLLIY